MANNIEQELGATEKKLLEYIKSEYKSLRDFCIKIDRPYSTISNMLKRGLLNSSVSLVLYVVDRLSLDIDELFNGNVVMKTAKTLNPEISAHEIEMIKSYRNNPEMQPAVNKLLGLSQNNDIASDMQKTVLQGETSFNKNRIGAK